MRRLRRSVGIRGESCNEQGLEAGSYVVCPPRLPTCRKSTPVKTAGTAIPPQGGLVKRACTVQLLLERSDAPSVQHGSSGPAAIRACDDLEIVAVGIVPIQAAAPVIVVDLRRSAVHGISPIVQPARANALENGIELRFPDEEGVMLDRDGLLRLLKIERGCVVERHRPERAEACWRIPPEDLTQPCGGRSCVTCRYDRVIELNWHASGSTSR